MGQDELRRPPRWPEMVFTRAGQGTDGVKPVVRLLAATFVPIRRHILVGGDANPFHPGWRDYCQQRRTLCTFQKPSQVANLAGRSHPQIALPA